ncbi:MAG TPA: hypothetical protein VH309_05265, partial [Elusimicrobiota bacterium]|nr:hypothetical protein [Elusimicrobiota bacterium]
MTIPSPSKTKRFLRAAVAAALAFVLVALAPGLAPYEAAAQVFTGSVGAAGRGIGAPIAPVGISNGGVVVAIPAGTDLAPALNSAPTFTAAPSASLGLTAAPAAANAAPFAASPAAAASAFAPAAFPALPASALLAAPSAVPSAAIPAAGLAASNSSVSRAGVQAAALRTSPAASIPNGRENAPSPLLGELTRAARALDSADSISKAGFLDRLFTGARSYFGLIEPSPAAASASASVPAAPSADFAALTPAPQRLLPASTPDEAKAAASSESRAVPPSPVVQVSDGLNPGSKLLAGAADSAPAAKPEAPVQGPSNDDWIDVKGMAGMFAQRSISIGLFIMTALAYPLIAIHAVGAATFGVLMALGPLAAIATGPLNGLIADRLSPRNGLIMLSLFRAVQVISLPLLAHFGMLNFGTLLAMSIANGWQLSL